MQVSGNDGTGRSLHHPDWQRSHLTDAADERRISTLSRTSPLP